MEASRVGSGMSAFMAYWKSTMEQSRKDFRELSAALKSGDLEAAQGAFADLQTVLPNNTVTAPRPATNPGCGDDDSTATAAPATPPKDAAKDPRATVRADVDALGTALHNGDLKGAQEAFAKLTQDMKALRGGHHGHHHHHHHGVEGSRGTSATPTSPKPISTPAAPDPSSVVAKTPSTQSEPTFFGIDLKA